MNDFELSCMVLNENEIRDASSPLMTAEEALSSTAEGQPGETSGMAWLQLVGVNMSKLDME